MSSIYTTFFAGIGVYLIKFIVLFFIIKYAVRSGIKPIVDKLKDK